MEDFLPFVLHYDPDFRSRIRGATASEIDQLEELVGLSLPQDYRTYLTLMGHYDDGLDLFVDAHAFLRDVREYYAECKADGDEPAPPGYVMVAVDGVGVRDMCIDATSAVYQCDRTVMEGPFAERLAKRAKAVVFDRYAPRRFTWSATFASTTRTPLRDAVRVVASTLGLEPRDFSDRWTFYADDANRCVCFSQQEGQAALLRVAAATQEEIRQIGARFESALTFQLHRWFPGNTPIYRRLPPPSSPGSR
jgi:hypothetical protein